ncbi:MAG: hypothetical protein FD166_3126 [Bacteroidetes bacterium]|nr:MAG: hypothetical protein FD166_3126 [Bacteroidota bacterium]
MKSTAEKSTTSTTSVSQKSGSSFFAKAGGGDFFAPVRQGTQTIIQTKLAVNKPGDKFEREADSVAERVMRMSGGARSVDEGKKIESQVEEKVQRREDNSLPEKEAGNQNPDESTQTAIRSKTGGGMPLPRPVRDFMEPRFGNDFSNVRIHNDDQSSQLSRQLNARAFTHKNHIFFGSGQYNPDTKQGKQLLAHELTHVVQQGSSPGLSNQGVAPAVPVSESRILQQTGESGSQLIQRNTMDTNAEGSGLAPDATTGFFRRIGAAIGAGIAAATSWIQGIASRIRAGIAAAWSWVSNLASRIGQGLQSSRNWIQELASTLGTGLDTAWGWIQNIANRIGMGLSAAWGWIRSVAGEIGTGIVSAWAWIESAAARLGLSGSLAWQWIRRLASMVGMVLTTAWTWIEAVAARLTMMITSAWQWIQMAAGFLRMTITTAWIWIQLVAARISMFILATWIWIQSVAAMIGMVIAMAWQWIQMAASLIMMTIIRAWNWLYAASLRIGRGVTAAFTWLMSMAARAGKMIVSAYHWLLAIAVAVGRGIVSAWNWLIGLVKRFALTIAEFWDWWINAPDIDIETTFAAPDGSGKSRKKVGVGERVTFTGSKTGEWKATGGIPLAQATGTRFVWTAPDRAATLKVSLKSGKYTRDVVMNVLEPNAITARKKEEMTFRRGRQGVGMKLKFHYHPKTVSFGNADAREVSGPATGVRGYFATHGGDYHHDSGDTFYPINHDNVDSATDTAAMWNYPAPWSRGGYDWIIPNRFKVRTESGDGKKFTDVTQSFTIEGTDGTSTVSKGGESAERTP